MSGSEDYFLDLESDMEENQINEILAKKIELEKTDNILAYTA